MFGINGGPRRRKRIALGRDNELWLPILDAFRTFVFGPPTQIGLVFRQVRELVSVQHEVESGVLRL